MTNLYTEICEILAKNNLSVKDILWVGCKSFTTPVDEFLAIAKDTDYDNGFGGEEIFPDLIISGSNWWLERHEYDGSEWFEFKKVPTMPSVSHSITTVKTSHGEDGESVWYMEELGF